MKYAKIERGIVVQTQKDGADGFDPCPGWVVCGMLFDGASFTLPEVYHVPDPKLSGIEFDGVMCSATAIDMWGLSSVKAYVQGGKVVNFEFENGSVLQLTLDNLAAFEAVWVPFRASFF